MTALERRVVVKRSEPVLEAVHVLQAEPTSVSIKVCLLTFKLKCLSPFPLLSPCAARVTRCFFFFEGVTSSEACPPACSVDVLGIVAETWGFIGSINRSCNIP